MAVDVVGVQHVQSVYEEAMSALRISSMYVKIAELASNTDNGVNSRGGATATFSGAWVPAAYFLVQGFAGPNGLWVFAVHDGGHTKMVGMQKTEQNNLKRVDGRYTPKGVLTKMNTDSIIAAWDACSNRGVDHGKYTLSDVKFT